MPNKASGVEVHAEHGLAGQVQRVVHVVVGLGPHRLARHLPKPRIITQKRMRPRGPDGPVKKDKGLHRKPPTLQHATASDEEGARGAPPPPVATTLIRCNMVTMLFSLK